MKKSANKSALKVIVARGVRTHNLRNIRFRIPLGKFTVVTGVSGSGKSSLAIDTLYAEGERRYVESLSAYARQFLEKMARPDVDYISSIPPAIAIEHRNDVKNARSTVGTATEIYDYLRLLFARIGRTECASCGGPVERVSPSDVAKFLSERAADEAEILLVAPLAVAEDRSSAELLAQARARGIVRVLDDGVVKRLDEVDARNIERSGRLEAVIDRVETGRVSCDRIAESAAMAYELAGGRLEAVGKSGRRWFFSETFSCLNCGRRANEPSPLLFSFNSPRGACPTCEGFGRVQAIDMDRVIPNPKLTLAEGAISVWQRPAYREIMPYFKRFARRHGIPWDKPYRLLGKKRKALIEKGDDDFPGLNGFFDYLKRKRYKVHVRVLLARLRRFDTCGVCGGTRLVPEALAVRLGALNIAQLCEMPVPELRTFLSGLDLSEGRRAVASELIGEIASRLAFLEKSGLSYLSLSRQMRTLSAGEAQRIRLAAALGSALSGILYILDEPTVGLHPRDVQNLVDTLRRLLEKRNTVVAIEHDTRVIMQSDYVIDLGPGGGTRGGRLLYQGPPAKLVGGSTPTGKALQGQSRPRTALNKRNGRGEIILAGARTHNLKEVTVRIPLGNFVCVTGVSGSGKSSLITDTLHAAYRRMKGEYAYEPPDFDRLEGADAVSDILLIDPSPPAKSRRSNIVTITGAYTYIRRLLADAGGRAARPGHFSFNVPGGRCERCQGMGRLVVNMVFMANVPVVCEECQGKRFKPWVLSARVGGKNVLDILEMTVSEAMRFFADQKALVAALAPLEAIGLGYVRLGQTTDTLSGGEAARLKLAAYLTERARRNPVLFLFDEPTTGLHPADIEIFLRVLDKLIEEGHSAVVIEHNLSVISRADHVIDLGPEGGAGGGQIVAAGNVEQLAEANTPTGRALKEFLNPAAV